MTHLKTFELPPAETVLDVLTAGGILVICALLVVRALQVGFA